MLLSTIAGVKKFVTQNSAPNTINDNTEIKSLTAKDFPKGGDNSKAYYKLMCSSYLHNPALIIGAKDQQNSKGFGNRTTDEESRNLVDKLGKVANVGNYSQAGRLTSRIYNTNQNDKISEFNYPHLRELFEHMPSLFAKIERRDGGVDFTKFVSIYQKPELVALLKQVTPHNDADYDGYHNKYLPFVWAFTDDNAIEFFKTNFNVLKELDSNSIKSFMHILSETKGLLPQNIDNWINLNDLDIAKKKRYMSLATNNLNIKEHKYFISKLEELPLDKIKEYANILQDKQLFTLVSKYIPLNKNDKNQSKLATYIQILNKPNVAQYFKDNFSSISCLNKEEFEQIMVIANIHYSNIKFLEKIEPKVKDIFVAAKNKSDTIDDFLSEVKKSKFEKIKNFFSDRTNINKLLDLNLDKLTKIITLAILPTNEDRALKEITKLL